MKRTRISLVACAALLAPVAGSSLAQAQDDEEPDFADATVGSSEVKSGDQLVAPKGAVVVSARLDIGLSEGSAGEPISLAPDVWFGATDDLSLGLVHSSQAGGGFYGGAGSPAPRARPAAP